MWISFNQSIWKGGEGEIVVSSMENRSYRPPTVSGLLSITFVTIYTAKCLKIHFSHQFVFLLSSPFLSRFIQLPLLLWLLCIMLRHSLFIHLWMWGVYVNATESQEIWQIFSLPTRLDITLINDENSFVSLPLSNVTLVLLMDIIAINVAVNYRAVTFGFLLFICRWKDFCYFDLWFFVVVIFWLIYMQCNFKMSSCWGFRMIHENAMISLIVWKQVGWLS